jgi:hypothetical protein
MKPGGDIQPVVGSLFSPPTLATEPETPSKELAKPVTPRANREIEVRTGLAPSSDAPGDRELPIAESDRQSVASRIPTSVRTSLIPCPKEKNEAKIAPLLPVYHSDPLQEGAARLQQKTSVQATPEQKVAGQLGAIPLVRVSAAAQNPTKQAARNPGAEPALAMPGAEGSTKPSDEARNKIIAGRVRRSFSGGGRSRSPFGAGAQQIEDEQEHDPVISEFGLKETLVSQGASGELEVDHPAATVTRGPAMARKEVGTLAGSDSKALAYGAPGKEGTRPPRSVSQPQPDEIQIHIGRIEVIAVPAAPAQPALATTQRKTPSLDEYLQRRDGGPV